MADCKDCIHYDVCQYHITEETPFTTNECDSFINKSDVVEKKDCEKCIHFGKHATQYPCSHCRNCYTDKFQQNDKKERGNE